MSPLCKVLVLLSCRRLLVADQVRLVVTRGVFVHFSAPSPVRASLVTYRFSLRVGYSCV